MELGGRRQEKVLRAVRSGRTLTQRLTHHPPSVSTSHSLTLLCCTMASRPVSTVQVLLAAQEAVRNNTVPRSATYGYPKFSKMTQFTNTETGQPGIRGIRLCRVGGEDDGAPQCPNCGAINDLKACSRCKAVFYCDAECQRYMWPQHKRVCKPPAVVTDATT